MGGKIPVKTKQKVLKHWLLGVARKKIAEKIGIGEGTVTSIVQDAKENIPDVDLLHELATKITRNILVVLGHQYIFIRNQTSKNPL